jgi:hypothetical protein
MPRFLLRAVCGSLALVLLLWPIASIAAGPLPGLWVTPLELDFGPVGVGTTSAPQVVTISNIGTIDNLTNFAGGAPFDPQFGATQNCAGGVAPGASCQYTFSFTPTKAGVFASTSNSSTNAGPFIITLHGQSGNVPPGASLSFAPNPIAPGGVSRMQLALSNQNRAALVDDVLLSVALPPGVRVAASPQASTSGCGAAIVTAAGGSNSVTLEGARIARNVQCLIGVNLTAPSLGSYTISTGVIGSSNSGASSGTSGVLQVGFKRFVPLMRR